MMHPISTLATGSPYTTSGTGSSSNSSSTNSSAGTLSSMSKDQFLMLLVTQLKNQDPMSPMDSSQFATQLAQFTSVEQLVQLNTAVGNQSTAVQMGTLSGQAALGASLIGRQVIAEGNGVSIPASGKASVVLDVGTGGGKGTLTLKNAAGEVVATRDLGMIQGGHQTVALPSDLPAGDYTYSVSIKDSKDAAVPVATYTTGVVSAVEFNSGSILLRLGGLKVALGSVTEVDPAPGSSTTATNP
jgi:flagellar basal-body rod modification protein FlgD